MSANKKQLNKLSPLRKRADFLILGKKGKKWVSSGFILQVKPNDLGIIRVGFTVSKRVSKLAVKRNRIKRRLRAITADVLPVLARNSCDYVLIGRAAAATRPYKTLLNDLKWCLDKLGYNYKQKE